MKASWEKIEKNQGVLTIEVDEQRVAQSLDQAFKKVVQKINVPGFRKGKVPRSIFEARFGVEALYQDALDLLLPEAYTEAVKETGIEPIDRPEVDIDEFAKGKVLKFKATVQVKPEVELGEYKGLEVKVREPKVEDSDVEDELKRLQQRHAELVVIEEGAAEKGDIAIIDFEGFIDGVPFEGGAAEKHSLELGSNSFIGGFEDQVIGMTKGEEKDINVTFPEDYHAENLKGKPAVFKVKLHDIKRKNLPELDDEFAKDVSEFDTLEEFKADIVNKLQERKEREVENEKEQAVIEKAVANAKVEIPQVMIDSETENMVRDFENRLRMQGMNLDLYFQFSGQDLDALKAQMSGDAEQRVRNNLVLEAVAKAENLQATDEEIDAELEKLSGQYQRSAAELHKLLEANGNLADMKNDLTVRKAIKFLVEQSKAVTDAA